MSFQSSILNMIHTASAGLKAVEFVKNEKKERPTAFQPQAQPEPMQPSQAKKEEPAKVKEEPVYIGGQQVSPEIAAKVRKALEHKQNAEASMVVAQQQKRAKRAKAFSDEPEQDLLNSKHLGMEAII